MRVTNWISKNQEKAIGSNFSPTISHTTVDCRPWNIPGKQVNNTQAKAMIMEEVYIPVALKMRIKETQQQRYINRI